MKTLRELNPEAAEMWYYELNGDMTPDNTPGKSGKLAYFQCKKNPKHIFQKKIYAMTAPDGSNRGCLYCDGRVTVAFPGETDFFTTVPEAKALWDFDKNEGLDPTTLLPGSTVRANFKCSRGHEFNRQIQNITESPYCKICYLEDNNITKTNPELLDWWNYKKNGDVKPEQFTKASCKKVWWECPKCHFEWQAEIATRVISKGMCPCCEARLYVKTGVNDMFSLVPDIKMDFDFKRNKGIDYDNIKISSTQKLFWKCHTCGYKWKASPSSRISPNEDGTYRFNSCPACVKNARLIPFYVEYPKLYEKFDINANPLPIDAYKVSYKEKLWWNCFKCGESFQCTIRSMIRGYNTSSEGCTYCSGSKVAPKKSFGYLHPECMDEYASDNELNAYEVAEKSTKKARWKCRNNPNHKWIASFQARARGFGTCPECQNRTYGKMLSIERPDLKKYYDTSKNTNPFEQYTFLSNKAVYWMCDNGHSVKRNICNVSKVPGYECPVCNNRILQRGINDLASQYPELSKEYDSTKNPLPPEKICISSSDTSIWWKCDDEHSFQSAVSHRINTSQECPVCTRRIVVPGINDLKRKYPDIIKIWDYDKNERLPEHISDRTIDRFYFKCDKGHSYTARKEMIANYGCKCLVCENKILAKGVNSFADARPELLDEWSPNNIVSPEDVLCSMHLPIKWICLDCQNEYTAHMHLRRKGDNMCPICNNKKLVAEINSFGAVGPKELVAEWSKNNSVTAWEVFPDTLQRWLWECPKCGGEYSYPLKHRYVGDTSCPYCNGKKALAGLNSFADVKKELLPEWSPRNELNPSEILPTSCYSALWICPDCHGEYSFPIRNRTKGDDSCPYCSNRKPLSGYNTLKVKCESLMKEWNYRSNYLIANPDSILPTYSEEVWWTCECGKNYKMSPQKRLYYQKRNMKSCPYCKGRRRKKYRFF